MNLSRRRFLTAAAVAAPAIILTPGLLMPIKASRSPFWYYDYGYEVLEILPSGPVVQVADYTLAEIVRRMLKNHQPELLANIQRNNTLLNHLRRERT